MEPRQDLRGMKKEEIVALMEAVKEPSFRGEQVFQWVQGRGRNNWEEMHNLPHCLREKLATRVFIAPLKLIREWEGQAGTRKFLFELFDGEKIESVLLKHPDHHTLCISTQVGCRFNCLFCATGKMGLKRNLMAGEITGQVLEIVSRERVNLRNIVFMGMGEPLDNLEAVLKAIALLEHPQGQNIGQRRITISTCGLIPEINQLAARELQCVLAISLHAPGDDLRSKLVPINRRYPLEDLLQACRNYFTTSGRRISFEYALIEGINDTPDHAHHLAALLSKFPAHINLLSANPIQPADFKGTGEQGLKRFLSILEASSLPVTVRKTRGQDIQAACGQLNPLEGEV